MAHRWTFKKRGLYIYLPAFLAIDLLFEIATENSLSLLGLLTIYIEMFVFFYAACLLLYGLGFHLFDFLKWVVRGMKASQDG